MSTIPAKSAKGGAPVLNAPTSTAPNVNFSANQSEPQRTGKQTFLSLATLQAFLIFCLINFALYLIYCPAKKDIRAEFKKSDLSGAIPAKLKKPWPWWLARGYLACRKPIDVVVFGSSQMGSAQATIDAQSSGKWVDVITHRTIDYLADQLKDSAGGRPLVLSLAMPGAVISDESLMTRVLLKRMPHPRVAVISVAPRDFIDNTLPAPSATDLFKFFSPYVNLGELDVQAYNDPFAYLDARLRGLPTKVLGADLQASFKSEQPAASKAATDVLQAVTAAPQDPSPEQWVVPPVMPEKWTDNTLEYRFRFKGPNMHHYRVQMCFFRQMLKDLREMNVQTIVIGMPSMKMNRDLLPESFWSKLRSDVQRECAAVKAHFRDLTGDERFVQSDYLDTVHLNARGASKLMPVIAEEIRQAADQ